jgi:hypothetical protein
MKNLTEFQKLIIALIGVVIVILLFFIIKIYLIKQILNL